jgi:hypothetical protein
MIKKLLISSIGTAVLLALVVTLLLISTWRSSEGRVPVEQFRVFLDAYKAIGIGFLVAIIGALLPQLLPEARDHLERFKDSRIAYSEAKTSVIYLPQELACLSFAESISAVETAHRKLHLAETYKTELRQHLKEWHPWPDTWTDRNYWELMAMRTVLNRNIAIWPDLTPSQRLDAVLSALHLVEQVFGRENVEWGKLTREDRESKMLDMLGSNVQPFTLQTEESDTPGISRESRIRQARDT